MRVTNEKQGLLCVKTPEFLENTALIYAIYTIHKNDYMFIYFDRFIKYH